MRFMLVFAAALTIGALTVTGQENKGDDLRQRIRALTEELRKRADLRGPPDLGGKPILRIYDVGDLVFQPGAPEPWAGPNLTPSKYKPPELPECSEPRSPFDVDWIVEMVRQVVEPETWDTIESAEIAVKNTRLFVNTIPRVQNKIPALLAALRRSASRELFVEVFSVPVESGDDALLLNRPRELTDAEAGRLLAREALGGAVVHCLSGERLSQRAGQAISYLQDYDVEIAQEATIGDPIRQTVFAGTTVTVAAHLDESARGARLDLALDRTAVQKPVRRVDTEHGPLELPVLELTRLQTSIWVPLGKVTIVGGGTAGAVPCLFLVKVVRVPSK